MEICSYFEQKIASLVSSNSEVNKYIKSQLDLEFDFINTRSYEVDVKPTSRDLEKAIGVIMNHGTNTDNGLV